MLKNLCSSPFNKDLSNGTPFSPIHLAGLYERVLEFKFAFFFWVYTFHFPIECMTSTSTLQEYLFYFAAEIFLSGPGYDVAPKATLKTQAAIALSLSHNTVYREGGRGVLLSLFYKALFPKSPELNLETVKICFLFLYLTCNIICSRFSYLDIRINFYFNNKMSQRCLSIKNIINVHIVCPH